MRAGQIDHVRPATKPTHSNGAIAKKMLCFSVIDTARMHIDSLLKSKGDLNEMGGTTLPREVLGDRVLFQNIFES